MGNSAESSNADLPVTCDVCGTRIYAKASQIGKQVRCPDCQTLQLVKSPPPTPAKPKPQYTGDEYQLQEEVPPSPKTESPRYTRVVCEICSTAMNIRVEHVGKRVRFPDCGTPNLIKAPAPKANEFELPDVQDVVLEEAPPANDHSKQVIAERLMSNAAVELREAEAEDQQPISPEKTKLLAFILQLKILPVWITAAVGTIITWHLIEVINDLTSIVSLESIFAVFLTIITAAFATALAGFIAPQLLAITSFTSDGFDRIPYWPSHDLLDRFRSILMIANSVALAAAPGMLLATLLSPLGIPLWTGMLSTLLLLPFILLSMMDNDSAFLPYSAVIHSSLSTRRSSWNLFYLQSVGLFAISAFPAGLCWLLHPMLGRVVLCFAGAIYVVLYPFLLGRLAWMIGDIDPDDSWQGVEFKASEESL